MKFIQASLLSVFLISATFSFGETAKHEDGKELTPIQNQNDFPNVFRPFTNLFRRITGRKSKTIGCYFGPDIAILNLDKTEMTKGCVPSNNNENMLRIKVYADVSTNDANYAFLYNYKVSAGKIIGEGKEVIWDLSDLSQGIYTISAFVDNGCGLCGKVITKTISISDCPK
jgi:hypothetical protein